MYGVPFRKAALQLYGFFGSMHRTARALDISVSTVHRWTKRIEPLQRVRRSVKLTDAILASVRFFLASSTLLSSWGVVEHVQRVFGVCISRQLAHLVIKRLGYSFKRTRKRGVSKTYDHVQRMAFVREFTDAYSAGMLVAVDESGFDHRCTPQYAYALKGRQAIVHYSPSSDRRRLSLLMAIHPHGLHHRVVSDKPVNGASFATFVSSLPYPPGTTLLLDNASIHKTKLTRDECLKRRYRLLFTPPYSPECNPIELVFGIAKQHFYKNRYLAYDAWKLDDAVNVCVFHALNGSNVRNCFDHTAKLLLPSG